MISKGAYPQNTMIKGAGYMNRILGPIDKRSFLRSLIILFLIWIISVSFLAVYSAIHLSKSIYEELGKKSMLIAIDVAYELEEQRLDFARLKSLDFVDLLQDPENMDFERRMREVMTHSDIKYIYMETILDDKEVKYYVEPGEEEIYGAPAGTPLDVIYLLDAVKSHEIRMEDTDGKWYTDKDRYINIDDSLSTMYANNAPGYMFVKDRWGNYFTGYAPVHGIDGSVVGIVGVDLFLENFYSLIRLDMIIVGGFTAVNLVIGVAFAILVRRLRNADRQVAEKTLQSSTDYLTSCMNRRSFNEALQNEWRAHSASGRSVALLFVDIDFFKEYNDYYGHLSGDAVLCKIASALRDICEPLSGYVSRYGGDEFIVLLPDAGNQQASAAAEKIIAAVAALKIPHMPSPVADHETVSIGAASMIPIEGSGVEAILEHADSALYRAKRYGRNRLHIWDGETPAKHHSKEHETTI